jgi:hypothetical protein
MWPKDATVVLEAVVLVQDLKLATLQAAGLRRQTCTRQGHMTFKQLLLGASA